MSRGLTKCAVESAKSALIQCIPGATFMPDQLFKAAEGAGFAPKFERIEGADSLSKEQLFDAVFAGQSVPEATVFVVTDELLPGSAFTYEGQSLRDAVLSEALFLFDCDLLFVGPALGLVIVFHHEGGYFHVHSL